MSGWKERKTVKGKRTNKQRHSGRWGEMQQKAEGRREQQEETLTKRAEEEEEEEETQARGRGESEHEKKKREEKRKSERKLVFVCTGKRWRQKEEREKVSALVNGGSSKGHQLGKSDSMCECLM